MSSPILKIAIVGPESTGKSTMSAHLAKHYHTIWVPEFARDYCAALTGPPTLQDELNMFHGQLALEEEHLPKANKILICDTTFITIKIWSDHMFGHTPPEVIEELNNHHYDCYLLLNIDLPWEDDPLRDFPGLREHFMDVWVKELNAINANYTLISGLGQDRYQNGVTAINTFLKSIH
ncbi:ATP-binding protein [Mucilaginibacter sp. HMF5004]|uniref:AAA family ATPase n=1 Tax=Mucilaginibacter rivuli TaxID=2857527 RepID=UPI001C60135A|nr:ATP-binding protein [Mucilaginibacter rivuli]MBW4888642.1 ATP-binding protein [Mucilaginibacter rivuli]